MVTCNQCGKLHNHDTTVSNQPKVARKQPYYYDSVSEQSTNGCMLKAMPEHPIGSHHGAFGTSLLDPFTHGRDASGPHGRDVAKYACKFMVCMQTLR
jgi:hypothetical protein